MKILFTICAMLLASGALFAQVITAKEAANWERAKVYTKEYLDVMPDDGYSLKPTPEMRSFAQQMGHLADANYAFVASATGKAKPTTESVEKMADQSKAAITKAVMDSYDFVITSLKGTSDADLSKDVKVFGFAMTSGVAFEKAFEHQTHHRGQTTVYIRLKGAVPPREKLL
ncbi:DinB family protein [Dyadobacter sp. 32]|uniref:DinB family protein n=1 Tax=Dyadobacter sp. 32 TaxID=538966 RepID=UPI0011EE860C